MKNKAGLQTTLESKGFTTMQDDDTRLLCFDIHSGVGYELIVAESLSTYGYLYKLQFPKPSEIPDSVLLWVAEEWIKSGYDEGVRGIINFGVQSSKDKDKNGFPYYDKLFYSFPELCVYEQTQEFGYLDKQGYEVENSYNEKHLEKLYQVCTLFIDHLVSYDGGMSFNELFDIEPYELLKLNSKDLSLNDYHSVYSILLNVCYKSRWEEQWEDADGQIHTNTYNFPKLTKRVQEYLNSKVSK